MCKSGPDEGPWDILFILQTKMKQTNPESMCFSSHTCLKEKKKIFYTYIQNQDSSPMDLFRPFIFKLSN